MGWDLEKMARQSKDSFRRRARSSSLEMICDPFAGIGEPETAGDHTVEYPTHTCQYHFEWRSLYACPLCEEEDMMVFKGACSNVTRTREVPSSSSS